MESQISDLPPLKRFRMMQQQEENNHSKCIPDLSENIATPSCLPAKKRMASRDSPPLPPISTAGNTVCLPAKKRIWAIQPFDLNIEYEPPSIIPALEIPPKELQKSPEVRKIEDGVEKPSVDEEDDDDGILCAVCGSTDRDPTDPIVLCDGCDLMVHASCYGHPFINGIPEGDWFCAECIESKSTAKTGVACCLCPVSGGALKPTTDGRWAHLVCAIYVLEVFFEDSEGREGIDCSQVVKTRWGKKCYVCESKNRCAVDFSELKYSLAFHVTCGLKEELCFEYKQGKNRGAFVAGFCRVHTDLWKKFAHPQSIAKSTNIGCGD